MKEHAFSDGRKPARKRLCASAPLREALRLRMVGIGRLGIDGEHNSAWPPPPASHENAGAPEPI